MKFLLACIIPLCSAQAGNHVLVSIGGSTYQHGAKHDQVAPAPVYTTAAPVYHAPAPVYTTAAPVYHAPAPVYTTAAPFYHNAPAAVYHTPATYQVASPAYITKAPSYATAAPVYHKPAIQYQAAPQYHAAPKYHTPKQNCSVVDEVLIANVCTPSFDETKCASVDVKVKAVVDKEQCQDITRTVCTTAEEVIDNEICVYSYEKKSEDTVAKTVKVTYAKECTSKRVTVCQPTQGYSHQSYGHQYCKEEDQQTCYNVPKVTAVDEKVSVVFPTPVKSCSEKPITIPRVSCEDLIENMCITVPDVEEKTEKVEKCDVALSEPSCQTVSLTLPKQVCVGLVYGHVKDITAQQYHAKVL